MSSYIALLQISSTDIGIGTDMLVLRLSLPQFEFMPLKWTTQLSALDRAVIYVSACACKHNILYCSTAHTVHTVQ